MKVDLAELSNALEKAGKRGRTPLRWRLRGDFAAALAKAAGVSEVRAVMGVPAYAVWSQDTPWELMVAITDATGKVSLDYVRPKP